jgi:hypothetical protein
VVRAGLTEQRVPDALPSMVNLLNQRRIKEDRRRNKSKVSAQEHYALRDKLNNSGFLALIDSDETQNNICNIEKRVIKYSNQSRVRS